MQREIKFRAWNGKEMIDNAARLLDDGDADLAAIDPKPHCIWLQYTGLHDKNGKEIYEGDIVDYKRRWHQQVVFEDGMFKSKDENGWGALILGHHNMEVIGNIYQNPELLTV